MHEQTKYTALNGKLISTTTLITEDTCTLEDLTSDRDRMVRRHQSAVENHADETMEYAEKLAKLDKAIAECEKLGIK